MIMPFDKTLPWCATLMKCLVIWMLTSENIEDRYPAIRILILKGEFDVVDVSVRPRI